jgi:hypothetical protein
LRTKEEIIDELQHVVTLGASYFDATQDAAALEFANLVAHTDNVETIQVEGFWRDNTLSGNLPIWLRSLTEAAQSMPTEIVGVARYNNLHTLNINMQLEYHSDVAYLFLLPGLRKLRLESMSHQDWRFGPLPDRWPVGAAVSNLHTLELIYLHITGNQVVYMINSCKALSHLKCDWGTRLSIEGTHEWTQEIAHALERHSHTLKTLLLDPKEDEQDLRIPWFDWPRIEGLEKLSELQSLTIPFYVLTGRPAGKHTGEAWASTNPNWHGFPAMREVLPPNVQSLSLSMGPYNMYPNDNKGYDQLFLAVLLPLLGQKLCLEEMNLTFGEIQCYHQRQLPMDFWEIQKAFHYNGVAFDYQLRTDLGEGGTCDPSSSWYQENTCNSFILASTQYVQQSCCHDHTNITLNLRLTD